MLFLLQSARTKYKGEGGDDYYTKLFSGILSYKEQDLYSQIKEKFKIKSQCPALPYINAVFNIVPQTFDLEIGIIINESNLDFITSDNPVIFCNQLFETKKLHSGFEIANIGIQFFLPISSKILLCMYDSDVSFTKHTNKIKKINRMIVNNSYEAIVFKYNTDSSYLIDYITKTAEQKATSTNPQEVSDNVIEVSNR